MEKFFEGMITGKPVPVGTFAMFVTGIAREQGYSTPATTWSVTGFDLALGIKVELFVDDRNGRIVVIS